MIKIEKLKNGAQATITRNGVTQKVYPAMIISYDELVGIEVLTGTVVYSVNEEVIEEISAGEATPAAPAALEEIKSPEPTEPAVEIAITDTVALEEKVVAEKPAIVIPTPRSAKK